MLRRAVASAQRQLEHVAAVAVSYDLTHAGAWATRNAALNMSMTTWTGFLDDDDVLLPHHVKFLLDRAEEHGLDLVWGWFDVIGGVDPFPMHKGRQFNLDTPHIVPITYMCKTELLRDAVAKTGGFVGDEIGAWDNQDQPLFEAMAREGKHMAFEEVTWHWSHHGHGTPEIPGNTSGLPSRW